MADLIIRPAKRNDAADLAILDNIAGHGISSWFWQGEVAKGLAEDAYDWGRSRFAGDEVFGWRNASVATIDDLIVGSVTTYVMPPDEDGEVDEIKRNAPAFMPVFELFERAVGSWFVDSMGVYYDYRGKGYGRKLFEYGVALARKSPAQEVMLVCEDTNTSATSLYRSAGFKTIDERPFVDFGNNRNVNKWLLMAAKL